MNYFLFALRNLKRKGIRSWLTLLGICIGIAAVVSLISLGSGLQMAVMSQFGVANTEVIIVQASGGYTGPPGSEVVNPLTKDDVRAIQGLSTVDYAYAENILTGKMEYNKILSVGYASSIPNEYDKEYYEINEFKTEYGRLLKSGDSGKVLLGINFYDGEDNGFGRNIIPGKKILLNDREFTVSGILKKTGSFLLDYGVFVYESDMIILSGNDDEADLITVKVKNKDLMNRTKSDIEKLLRQRRDVDVGGEDFSVSTPESSLNQVNSILGAIQSFIIIIASISIVIGAVGIVNTMATSVLERRKEIGIMKSVGAKNSQIFSQFFIESGFLGFIGGGIGVLFGVGLGYIGTGALNSFIGSDTQPRISFSLIFFSLFGSFLIGALAGIFPAMKAAKQNPVQALSS
jgi:putative ABC transport system permease protein